MRHEDNAYYLFSWICNDLEEELVGFETDITEEEIDNSILKSLTDIFGQNETYALIGFEKLTPQIAVYHGKPVIFVDTYIDFKDRKTSAPMRIATAILVMLEE